MHQNCHQIMIKQSVLNFTHLLIYSPAAELMEESSGRTWGQLIIQVHNSNVIVCYGVPHVQHHNPFMACSDPFQLFIYYRQIQNTWLCHGMVTILVHLAICWCTSCATPWLLHDFLWFLSPFKCPLTPEKDHISHSEQIQNTLLRHDLFGHFGAFWCILVHLMCDPMTCSDCYPLLSVHLLQKWIT